MAHYERRAAFILRQIPVASPKHSLVYIARTVDAVTPFSITDSELAENQAVSRACILYDQDKS